MQKLNTDHAINAEVYCQLFWLTKYSYNLLSRIFHVVNYSNLITKYGLIYLFKKKERKI